MIVSSLIWLSHVLLLLGLCAKHQPSKREEVIPKIHKSHQKDLLGPVTGLAGGLLGGLGGLGGGGGRSGGLLGEIPAGEAPWAGQRVGGGAPFSGVSPYGQSGGFQASGDAPWSLPPQAYAQSLTCPIGLSGPRGVVLMVPGTGCRGSEVYAKSPYSHGLPGLGFSYCWIDLPRASTVDMQVSGEMVAHAIRSLATATGRPISVLSYSQGGPNVQWALTFWPSLRPLVQSFVAMAPPMRGTVTSGALCTASILIGGCLPALFQQTMGSNYMKAINAGEGAAAQVSTTVIYSYMDEIVAPQIPTSVSTLPGASNIAVQQICGLTHVVDHFLMPADSGAYGIVIDALVSGRPANPQTINRSYCSGLGSTLGYAVAGLPNDLKFTYRSLVGSLTGRVGMILNTLTTLRTPSEPLLQPYVCQRGFATSCGPQGFTYGQNSKFLLSNLPLIGSLGALMGH